METDWSEKTELSEKILKSVVLKEVLIELSEQGSIASSSEFMYKKKRSYAQIQKVKKYLVSKGVIEVQKIGKFDKMLLTKKGKEIVTALTDFIRKTSKINGNK